MSTIKVNKIENTSTTAGGVAIDSSGHVQVDGLQMPTTGVLSNRNKIINGDMRIDQRNAGASVTIDSSNTLFSVDRFQSRIEQATAAMTVQQSTTAPAGFVNSLLHTVTNTTAPAAGNRVHTRQIIEGYNIADLGWGSANAQTITLSFWVRSSVTGTYGVGFINSAENRSYVGTYTVNTADTFEYKTITVDGDTSGTWLTNNSNGIRVTFDLGSGTTFNATSADTWVAQEACRTSGCVNFQQNSGATFYLTGVQLEVGEKATPFEHRSFGDELARCQRYFHKSFQQDTAPAQDAGLPGGAGFISTTAGLHEITYFYPVPLRAIPTTIITYSPNAATSNWSTNTDSPSASIPLSGEGRCTIRADAPTAAGRLFAIHLTAEAEL